MRVKARNWDKRENFLITLLLNEFPVCMAIACRLISGPFIIEGSTATVNSSFGGSKRGG
jgi:hypothetical protein